MNQFGYYFIPIKSICWTRKSKCLKCPLRSPQKRIISCTYLFNKIMGTELSKYLNMVDVGILWKPDDDQGARKALATVKKVLDKAV